MICTTFGPCLIWLMLVGAAWATGEWLWNLCKRKGGDR